jgi:hypothetical protein
MADPLGEVKVILGADVAPLQAAVQEANDAVSTVAATAETASARVETSTARSAGGFKALTRAISAVLGPIGILTSAFGLTIGALIRLEKKFNETSEATKKAREQIVELTKVIDREFAAATEVEKLEDRFDSLEKQIRKTVDSLGSRSEASAWLAQLDRLILAREQAIKNLSGRIDAERQKALSDVAFEDIKRQEALRDTIEEQIASLGEAALPEETQIRNQYKRVFDAISGSLTTSILPAGEIDEYLEKLRAAIDSAEEYALQKSRERTDDETKRKIESGERVAKANADAFEREMERVLATLSSSFGFDLTGVDQIVSVGDKIAAAIDRNGGMR